MRYKICNKCFGGGYGHCPARKVSTLTRSTGEFRSYYLVRHRDGSTERIERFSTKRAPDGTMRIALAV